MYRKHRRYLRITSLNLSLSYNDITFRHLSLVVDFSLQLYAASKAELMAIIFKHD